MIINFSNFKDIYNNQIDMLLASTGLTTRCQLNFGISKKSLCPNCIYDPNLKKSANKYKTGGPVEFTAGKICPVCNGIGSYGEILTEDIYLAILWNYKHWISPPTNISNPEGFIQTICSKTLLHKIRQCKDMTVVVDETLSNPVFSLYEEPNFAGLGDNNYIFCMWKKTGAQNIVSAPKITPTRSPTRTRITTRTPTPTNTKTPTITPTITNTTTNTASYTSTSSNTPTNTLSSSITPTTGIFNTNTPTPTSTPTLTITNTLTPTISPTSTRASGAIYIAGLNSANYNNCADWSGVDGNVTTVGTNGGPSAYGTFDMCGNVWEWTETSNAIYKVLRGGAYNGLVTYLASSFRNNNFPDTAASSYGFRIISLSGNPYNFSDFVPIGDYVNGNDTSPLGYGSVSYLYKMQTYEVTNSEYCNFLNAIAATDQYSLYDSSMDSSVRGGISQSGVSGSYTYSTKNNMNDKPVNYISWMRAARFTNWIHNGMPSGSQNSSTTESGVYTLNGASSGVSFTRAIDAKYAIPTEDEWYKAAYYKGDGLNSGYWNYATQSDTNPNCISVNSNGTPLPTQTATNTPTSSITPTISVTQTQTSTITATPTNTITQTNTPSNTPTNTPTVTITQTSSNTPTITPTNTSTQTPTQTITNTPSETPTQTPTISNTASETPTQTPTISNTASETPTQTPTNTPSETPTQTPTISNTASETPTQTPTISNTASETPTQTPTISNTASETPTQTPTNTPSETPTQTPTISNTASETPTQTPTISNTASETPTQTPTISNTASETPTQTPTISNTASETPTNTPTISIDVTQTPTPSTTPDNTLFGLYLPFSGNIIDSSPYNHTFTAYNGPVYSSGYLQLDGSNDFIATTTFSPGIGVGTSDFMVECWAYPTSNPASDIRSLIDTRYTYTSGGFVIWLDNTGKITFYTSSNSNTIQRSLTSLSGVTLNSWTHIAGTRENGILKLFINGLLNATNTSDSGVPRNLSDSAVIKIGTATDNPGVTRMFAGYIDDIKIIKRTVYTSNFTPPTRTTS